MAEKRRFTNARPATYSFKIQINDFETIIEKIEKIEKIRCSLPASSLFAT
jgi:hypothetical protein